MKVQTGQKSTDFKRIYLVSSNFLEQIHGFESQEIEIREFRKKLRVIYLYFHDPNSFAFEIEKIEQKEIQKRGLRLNWKGEKENSIYIFRKKSLFLSHLRKDVRVHLLAAICDCSSADLRFGSQITKLPLSSKVSLPRSPKVFSYLFLSRCG